MSHALYFFIFPTASTKVIRFGTQIRCILKCSTISWRDLRQSRGVREFRYTAYRGLISEYMINPALVTTFRINHFETSLSVQVTDSPLAILMSSYLQYIAKATFSSSFESSLQNCMYLIFPGNLPPQSSLSDTLVMMMTIYLSVYSPLDWCSIDQIVTYPWDRSHTVRNSIVLVPLSLQLIRLQYQSTGCEGGQRTSYHQCPTISVS